MNCILLASFLLTCIFNITDPAISGGLHDTPFAYDPLGSILEKSDGSATTSYAYAGTGYANPHAVTQIATTSLAYDTNGNLTAYGSDAYTWDYRNRLISSTLNAQPSTFYQYDHTMTRVAKGNGTATTTYPTRYYSTTSATSTKYVFAGDELITTIETAGATSTKRYIHTDHLGGTNVVTAADSGVVQVLDYYPYGDERINNHAGGVDEKRKFTGIERDESGLDYAINRYYDNTRGQFISIDPVFYEIDLTQDGKRALLDPQLQNSGRTTGLNSMSGFGFGNSPAKKNWTSIQAEFLRDPQMQNSYSYARNNPINMKDPEGLWGFAVTAGGNAELGPMVGGATFGGNSGFAIAGDGYRGIEAGFISNTTSYFSTPPIQSVIGQRPYTGVFGGSAGLNYGFSFTNGTSLSSFQNTGQSVNINVGPIGLQYSENGKGGWVLNVSLGFGAGYSLSGTPSQTLINGKSASGNEKKK